MARPPIALNKLALHLKSLHAPSHPLLLTNVWDASTASSVAAHPGTRAIATASYAIAMAAGVEDDDLTWPQNRAGCEAVARGIRNAGKSDEIPLTADLQDGYEDPAGVIREAIKEVGIVGCNLEDYDNATGKVRGLEESVERIRMVLKAAREEGVPDFVVNARTDALGFGGDVEEVIRRGKAFLEAGATTVFVWGVRKWEITEEEVRRMSEAFGGMLAVQPGSIGWERVITLPVARVSIGPALWRKSMEVFNGEVKGMLDVASR